MDKEDKQNQKHLRQYLTLDYVTKYTTLDDFYTLKGGYLNEWYDYQTNFLKLEIIYMWVWRT